MIAILLLERYVEPHPLMAPIMAPLTKYLCRIGYTATIGAITRTIVAMRTDSMETVREMYMPRSSASWVLMMR